MDAELLFKSAVMGVVEGLTEFLPISSTGHLIVASHVLGMPPEMKASFEIFIQLGAILAVVAYFARDLRCLLLRARAESDAWRLLAGVAVAFIPGAVVGFLLDDWITETLFSPIVVALALIAGGVVMWAVEQWMLGRCERRRITTVEGVNLQRAFWVGIAQVLSLIPGVSRAAATLVGGLLCDFDRPTALRFSFYLSIPTLGAAGVYSLVRVLDRLPISLLPAFSVGLGMSFVVALLVIRLFLRYVAQHDLRPFAAYRVLAGTALLALSYIGVVK